MEEEEGEEGEEGREEEEDVYGGGRGSSGREQI